MSDETGRAAGLKIGVALNITAEPRTGDAETVRRHLAIADSIETLGYDSIFVTEHHFSDYALTPSPFQILAYLAGRTSRVLLGTAVLVLPWHNPVRVAEDVLALNALSAGRAIIGVGRGTAGTEYDGLGVSPSDSERKFAEALRTLSSAIAGQAVGVEIRPRLDAGESIPLYTASTSGQCGKVAAEYGLGQLMSGQADLDVLEVQAARYKAAVEESGRTPVPPMVLVLATCRPDRTQAVRLATDYLDKDWDLVDRHYRYSHGNISSVPGYASHKPIENHFRLLKTDPHYRRTATADLIATQAIGSPLECAEKLQAIQHKTGADHIMLEFGYGGMPLEEVEASMALFAKAVLPVVHR